MPPPHHLHQGAGPNTHTYSNWPQHSTHGQGNGYLNRHHPASGAAPTISPPAFAYPYANPNPNPANSYTTPLPTPPVAPMPVPTAVPQPPPQTQYTAYTQSQAPPQIQLDIPSSRLSPSPSKLLSRSVRNSRCLSRNSTSSAGPTRYPSTRTIVSVSSPARNNSAVARWMRKTYEHDADAEKDKKGGDGASATESVLGEYMMFDDVDLNLDLDLGCIPEIEEDKATQVPEKDCTGRNGVAGGMRKGGSDEREGKLSAA